MPTQERTQSKLLSRSPPRATGGFGAVNEADAGARLIRSILRTRCVSNLRAHSLTRQTARIRVLRRIPVPGSRTCLDTRPYIRAGAPDLRQARRASVRGADDDGFARPRVCQCEECSRRSRQSVRPRVCRCRRESPAPDTPIGGPTRAALYSARRASRSASNARCVSSCMTDGIR